MSYAPCRFRPFNLPDFETLPPGVELVSVPRAPNPFLFDRGTAQFVQRPRVRVPIDMPKVKPNPPTNLSFSKIQDPWHQFGLKWQATCNVWSQHEVPMPPSGNMYGEAEQTAADKKTSDLRLTILAITALAVGTIAIASMAPKG
jgi:hypothetical protein